MTTPTAMREHARPETAEPGTDQYGKERYGRPAPADRRDKKQAGRGPDDGGHGDPVSQRPMVRSHHHGISPSPLQWGPDSTAVAENDGRPDGYVMTLTHGAPVRPAQYTDFGG